MLDFMAWEEGRHQLIELAALFKKKIRNRGERKWEGEIKREKVGGGALDRRIGTAGAPELLAPLIPNQERRRQADDFSVRELQESKRRRRQPKRTRTVQRSHKGNGGRRRHQIGSSISWPSLPRPHEHLLSPSLNAMPAALH